MTLAPPADDYVAVTTLLSRYVWALDTADIAALAGVFTEDAVLEDTRGVVSTGRDAVLAYFQALMDRADFRGRQHHIDALLMDPVADGYLCRSYWTVTRWIAAENRKQMEVVGWSTDHARRTPGGWKLAERRLHYWRDDLCPWAPEASRSDTPQN